jgi:FkbM family methyltransferase
MITRLIYPLSLRERISYKFYKFFPDISDKNINLEFNNWIKLDLLKTDIGHKSIIFNGFSDLETTLPIVNLAKQGGLMVDVGANFGYFSCLWAGENPTNKVIAFEASPDNVSAITNNVNKNGLGERVTIVPIAVGKSKGTLQFNSGEQGDQTGWGGLTVSDDDKNFTVKVDTLDNYMDKNNSETINVLKIDTEGADTWVLYGAEKLLREKKIQHIFFENNPGRMSLLGIAQHESVDFLRNLDYTVETKSPMEFYAYPNK